MSAHSQHRMDKAAAKASLAVEWGLIAAEPRRECDPTHSLDRQIAQARQEMGEARWAELNAEWGA